MGRGHGGAPQASKRTKIQQTNLNLAFKCPLNVVPVMCYLLLTHVSLQTEAGESNHDCSNLPRCPEKTKTNGPANKKGFE